MGAFWEREGLPVRDWGEGRGSCAAWMAEERVGEGIFRVGGSDGQWIGRGEGGRMVAVVLEKTCDDVGRGMMSDGTS